jgi:hypothetical protein
MTLRPKSRLMHCNKIVEIQPGNRLITEVRLAGRPPPYFGDSSLILLPPFATGMIQIGVATSAELRSEV